MRLNKGTELNGEDDSLLSLCQSHIHSTFPTPRPWEIQWLAHYARQLIYSVIGSSAANHKGTTGLAYLLLLSLTWGEKDGRYIWSVWLLHKLLTHKTTIELYQLRCHGRDACWDVSLTVDKIILTCHIIVELFLDLARREKSIRYGPDHLLIRDTAGSGIT